MNKDNYKKNKLFVLQKKWQHKGKLTFNQIRTAKIKKKKNGACVFWAPYFSKFFGGKICHIWTDVTYRANKFFWKN